MTRMTISMTTMTKMRMSNRTTDEAAVSSVRYGDPGRPGDEGDQDVGDLPTGSTKTPWMRMSLTPIA